mmetsp:Transcript_7457/g.15218  ORF Transcript_7457/g.15218 Transcript_7457/m.15218 type:complete len:858 (-) Transcript_7457:1535-4108(-)
MDLDSETQKGNKESLTWSLARVGGGSLGGAVSWLGSEEWLLVTRGRVVEVCSVDEAQGGRSTAERRGAVLTHWGWLSGHDRKVSGVEQLSRSRCVTWSLDGTIRVWALRDHTADCIQVWDVGRPLSEHDVAVAAGELSVEMESNNEDEASSLPAEAPLQPQRVSAGKSFVFYLTGSNLVSRNLKSGKTQIIMKIDTKSRSSESHVTVSCVGRAVVLTVGKAIYVHRWDRADNERHLSHQLRLRHPRPITAIALHPRDGSLALGDETGRIGIHRNLVPLGDNPVFWRNTEGVESQKVSRMTTNSVPHSTHHWHSQAVQCLAFSKDGAELYSGGHERVLVIWRFSSRSKGFLPRLGSGGWINSIRISPSGTLCSISTSDNSVRLVSLISGNAVAELKGIRSSSSDDQRLRLAPVSRYPGSVMISGLPLQIQIYDVVRDKHLAEFRICRRNVVSRAENNQPAPPLVEHVAMGVNGDVLISVDYRCIEDDFNVFESECLQFWYWQNESFALGTRVDRPHRLGRISSLYVHPELPIVVTTSVDSSFRVWKSGSDVSSWFCCSTSSYRGLPCLCAAISPDGSVIATGCGSVISLWNFDFSTGRTKLMSPLCHPPQSELVTSVSFSEQDSVVLVVSTGKSVYVWNILSLSITWSCSMNSTAIAVDPFSGLFAVAAVTSFLSASTGGKAGASPVEKRTVSAVDSIPVILFFSCESPLPISAHRLNSPLRSMAFISQIKGSTSVLACIDAEDEIFILSRAEAGSDLTLESEFGDRSALTHPNGDHAPTPKTTTRQFLSPPRGRGMMATDASKSQRKRHTSSESQPIRLHSRRAQQVLVTGTHAGSEPSSCLTALVDSLLGPAVDRE